MRRPLPEPSPAAWCLEAETNGGLADRVEHALRRRGERADVDAPRGAPARVIRGGRAADFSRGPDQDVVVGWKWYAECADGKPRDAEAALRWVLEWP